MFRAQRVLEICWCSAVALRIATAVLGSRRVSIPLSYTAHITHSVVFVVTDDMQLSQKGVRFFCLSHEESYCLVADRECIGTHDQCARYRKADNIMFGVPSSVSEASTSECPWMSACPSLETLADAV